eukprot:191991_1
MMASSSQQKQQLLINAMGMIMGCFEYYAETNNIYAISRTNKTNSRNSKYFCSFFNTIYTKLLPTTVQAKPYMAEPTSCRHKIYVTYIAYQLLNKGNLQHSQLLPKLYALQTINIHTKQQQRLLNIKHK